MATLLATTMGTAMETRLLLFCTGDYWTATTGRRIPCSHSLIAT
jgi:hypothetical protein